MGGLALILYISIYTYFLFFMLSIPVFLSFFLLPPGALGPGGDHSGQEGFLGQPHRGLVLKMAATVPLNVCPGLFDAHTERSPEHH